MVAVTIPDPVFWTATGFIAFPIILFVVFVIWGTIIEKKGGES